jgi:hypothetical protein
MTCLRCNSPTSDTEVILVVLISGNKVIGDPNNWLVILDTSFGVKVIDEGIGMKADFTDTCRLPISKKIIPPGTCVEGPR